ncbi:hypothetical protein FQA39_LY14271 [Lamprigera yunnana]|nr:hypothetical protein FQA39_LY14271 [Lamprigera yunnana]
MVILQLAKEPSLIQAIFSGKLDTVRNVLQFDDVNLQDCQKRSPLHAASYKGDVEIAELLLGQGASVNSKDSRWITPLHRACCCGSASLVSLLLEREANAMARDKQWQTPLHVAAANNAVECVELLLNYVSNINITDRMGRTALHHAAVNGHNDVVDLLIKKGCIVNACDKKDCRPLHYCAHMGHHHTINLLLCGGANINVKDRNQYSPLHVAAATGMDSACQALLMEGALVDEQNAYGNTPLHIACLNGHLHVCHVLISFHSNIEATNYRGQTALHISAASTHGAGCLNYLIKHKANINKQSIDGRTPLHMTAIQGRFTRSKTLIDKGAIVDCVDKNDCTALHISAQYGHDLLANTLLSYGADPKKKGYAGRTPLHMCCLSGYVECCRKFLQAQVEINAPDNSGKTPLHCAAYRGSIECLDLLVSKGASIDITDDIGRLPLHYAAVQGHYPCVYTLITLGSCVNTVDCEGCSPLHLAAAYDTKGECVKYLLGHKADPKLKDLKGFTPVHYAVANNNFSSLYTLLNFVGSNYTMYGPDAPLTTPLHLAARNGNQNILELLLSYFHDVNVRTENGSTALLLASRWGHTDCVQMLLRHGAKVSICDNIYRMSPIHYSSLNGHKHSLALLLDNAEDNNVNDLPDSLQRTALMLSIYKGNQDCTKMLLKCKADPNIVDVDKHSSLFRAVVNLQHDSVKLLILCGAKINSTDVHGKTILHLAAACGNLESMQIILKYMNENDATRLDNQQLTALHWACYSGYSSCVSLLLEKNIFKTIVGNPFSPVHCAIIGGKPCVELLCDYYGCSIINLKDSQSRTPLHIAALYGKVDCAKYLIEKGAEIDCKDSNGKTPLIAAAQNGQKQILELFLTHKSDVTQYDNNGNTALHLACLRKHTQTALLLLQHIQDKNIVNMVNDDRKIPLHLAAHNGLVNVTSELIKKGSSVLALDINGMTPALCCAPNQSVAQCLAIILANYSICSSQDNSLFTMKKSKRKKPLYNTQEIQTNISLLQNPDYFECKRLFNLHRTPSKNPFKIKPRVNKTECDEKLIKSMLNSQTHNIQELTRTGSSNCFLIENYSVEDTLPCQKQMGLNLHLSQSHMAIDLDFQQTNANKRRYSSHSFGYIYKMLKKLLREMIDSQYLTLQQEDLFQVVRKVMKKIDQSQTNMLKLPNNILNNTLEVELQKALKNLLGSQNKTKFKRSTNFNVAVGGRLSLTTFQKTLKTTLLLEDEFMPHFKVIRTYNNDGLKMSPYSRSTPHLMLNETDKMIIKEGLGLIKTTKHLYHINEHIKMFYKTLEKWPHCLSQSVEIMKHMIAIIKEQQWLERLKDDLSGALEQLGNSAMLHCNRANLCDGEKSDCTVKAKLSVFHIKPTEITFKKEIVLPNSETQTHLPGMIEKEVQANVSFDVNDTIKNSKDESIDNSDRIESVTKHATPQKRLIKPDAKHTSCNNISNTIKDTDFSDNEFY